MMDNRVFNVNGRGDEMLLDVLRLVFKQAGQNTRCAAWIQAKEHGLILLWHKTENSHGFPTPLKPESCLKFVSEWLASDQVKQVARVGWDADYDGDASNADGWRVYCEDWGHVADNHYAICAITPAAMWLGK